MKKMINYIRKNRMFVLLLSVIVIIIFIFAIYYVRNIKEPTQTQPIEEPEETVEKNTEISSFQGTYDSKTKQIRLTWSINHGKQTITALKLYHKDSVLADVNDLNSYVLNQAVYQFSGGDNVFVLQGTLDNGEKLEKEAHIKIDYFTSIACTTEKSNLGVLVKLTYKYHQSADIQTPRIVANSLPYNYTFNFKETTKTEPEDEYISASTVYEVGSAEAESDEIITIRWIFDSIGMSYDFPVTITRPQPKAEE